MVTSQALLLALALAASGETVLLEFSADWCGPCRGMEPTVRRLTDQGLPVKKVNVDHHPDVAAKYRVTGLPTFVMVVDGREVDRVVGATSYARLSQMLERARPSSGVSSVRGQSPDRPKRGWNLFGRGRQARSGTPTGSEELSPVVTVPSATSPPPRDPNSPASRTTDEPVSRALAATVRIRIEEAGGHSVGTGTVIDLHEREALVITCGHIFRDSAGKSPITVETFRGGRSHASRGYLVSYDLKRDVGMISFEPPHPIEPVPVSAGGNAIRKAANVFTIGCNHGADPTVQRSHITSIDKYVWPPNIEVAGEPVQGRSGGGLFTAAGELIGICNFADPADQEGIYASLATIHWELDRIGQRRIYQQQGPSLTGIAKAADPGGAQLASRDSRPATRAGAESRPTGDLEVICIVRSRSNPGRASQVYVLDQPPASLLNQLAGARQAEAHDLVPVEIARGRRAPVVRAQSEQ